MKKIIYTKKEVADILGCSITKIDTLIRNNEIGYFKYGTSKQSPVKFSEIHISKYLKSTERQSSKN